MDILEAVLKNTLNMESFSDLPPRLSDEESERMKADAFNDTEGNLNEDDGYSCSICKNRGIIMKVKQTRSGNWTNVACDCECMKIRHTIRMMQRSGLKNIIRDYTFSKFIATEDWQITLKEAAKTYSLEKKGWFFIGGQSGAGKTHLCTAICREFLLEGMPVKYMLWRDEAPKIKAAVNDAALYSAWMDPLKKVKVLYIDDLFKTGRGSEDSQKPTAADVNIAFEILNFRYNNPDLLTIISSECTVNDIINIDEAIGGRIFERAKAFSLKPDRSKNFRLKGVTEL
ncbi:ATP-binding protein [Treponema sp.]|uniref:ATP-binding protein n=1 Tax=Treponema sp. TaxID=166 RepID=UPI00388E20F9